MKFVAALLIALFALAAPVFPVQASEEEGLCVKALVILPFAPNPNYHLPKQIVLIGENGRIIDLPATQASFTVQWDVTFDDQPLVLHGTRHENYGVVQDTVAKLQIERVACPRGHGNY